MAIDCVHGPFVLCPCPSQMWLPITRALSIWTYCSYIYITTKLCFIWSISVNSSTFKFHVDSPFSPIIFSLPLLFPPSLPSVFSFFSYASPLTHHLSPTPFSLCFSYSLFPSHDESSRSSCPEGIFVFQLQQRWREYKNRTLSHITSFCFR